MRMAFAELFLIAIGLSMDAFAVAVCRGLEMRKINQRHALLIARFFGGFQALMPVIGFFLGAGFERYITEFDHWIAFGLLAFIGSKMFWEGWRGDEDRQEGALNLKMLTVMAFATSVDALAVGVTFAFRGVRILPAAAVIGLTTFSISLIGVCVGNRFGTRYKRRAELFGGLVLILVGLKILLEDLNIL